MAIFPYNKPRIVPFDPNSEPISIDDNINFANYPMRPTVNPTAAPMDLELPTRSVTNVMNGAEDDNWIQERFNSLYKPERENIDRLNAMIENMPQRNKPGLLRQIFGGIAQGLGGGPEARQEVLYRPYYNEMDDWNVRLDPIQRAAEIERNNNVNMRSVANQIVSQEMNQRRLDRQLDRDRVLAAQGQVRLGQGQARINQGEVRLGQADRRLDIAEEVANGGQFVTDDAGNARIIYKDGTSVPVDASYLSFAEKEKLKADSARSIEDTRQRNRVELVNEREKVRQQRIAEDKKLSIGADSTAWKLARQQYIADNPSHAIFWDKNGLPNDAAADDDTGTYTAAMESIRQRYNTIKQRATPNKGTSTNAPVSDQGTKEQVKNRIFSTKPNPPANKAESVKEPTTKRPGKTHVMKPDGTTGWIPNGQVSQIPKGWKVIN